MQGVEGRKAILVLSSGVYDTFQPRLNLRPKRGGRCRKNGVPIYAVGLMQSIRDIGRGKRKALRAETQEMDLPAGAE